MRNKAFALTLSTAVAGVFWAFFRWLQLTSAFEKDTLLPVRGAASTTIFILYMAAAAVMFAGKAIYLRGKGIAPRPLVCLCPGGAVPGLAARLFGLATAGVCVVLLLGASAERFPTVQRLFAAAGIFGGAAMFLMVPDQTSDRLGRIALPVESLFLCMWVIRCYKYNAEDPVLWHFLPEVGALLLCLMAWYELSAFWYGKGKAGRTLFFVQAAAAASIGTFFDERSVPETALFLLQAACLLLMEYLFVLNAGRTDEPRFFVPGESEAAK